MYNRLGPLVLTTHCVKSCPPGRCRNCSYLTEGWVRDRWSVSDPTRHISSCCPPLLTSDLVTVLVLWSLTSWHAMGRPSRFDRFAPGSIDGSDWECASVCLLNTPFKSHCVYTGRLFLTSTWDGVDRWQDKVTHLERSWFNIVQHLLYFSPHVCRSNKNKMLFFLLEPIKFLIFMTRCLIIELIQSVPIELRKKFSEKAIFSESIFLTLL